MLLNIFTKMKQKWLGKFVNLTIILPFGHISNTHTIIYEYDICHKAKHVRICYLQMLIYLSFSTIKNCYSMLFTSNACFTNKWRCGTKNLVEIHAIYEALKCMKTFHIQMSMSMIPKLKCTAFFQGLYQIGLHALSTLVKFILYNLDLHTHITIIFPFKSFTIYLFTLD